NENNNDDNDNSDNETNSYYQIEEEIEFQKSIFGCYCISVDIRFSVSFKYLINGISLDSCYMIIFDYFGNVYPCKVYPCRTFQNKNITAHHTINYNSQRLIIVNDNKIKKLLSFITIISSINNH